ncbi:hypothetical protein D3C71_1094810 [compost metagenome]
MSAFSSSTSEETFCCCAKGSAETATSVSFSMPKPGSIFSVRSRKSLVSQATSRAGLAVPARIAWIVLSTLWTIRSVRRAPRPRFSSSATSCTTSLPTYLLMVSAAPIGSWNDRETSTRSAVRIGSMGSFMRPNI